MNITKHGKWLYEAGLYGPLLTIAAAAGVLPFLSLGGTSRLVMNEEGFGPLIWPKVMLLGVIVSSAILCASRVRQFRAHERLGLRHDWPGSENDCDNLKLTLAFWAIVLYGISLDYIGFALGTFIFLLLWLRLAGIRKTTTVLATSLLGTIGLLYLFLWIAYLPLPRGVGVFDALTVGLYRMFGIY